MTFPHKISHVLNDNMQLHITAKSVTICIYANITQTVDNVNVIIKYNLLNALATEFTLQNTIRAVIIIISYLTCYRKSPADLQKVMFDNLTEIDIIK